jgi:hypothetical protein
MPFSHHNPRGKVAIIIIKKMTLLDKKLQPSKHNKKIEQTMTFSFKLNRLNLIPPSKI